MPYKFERKKIRLPADADRRRKLTDDARDMIIQLRNQGWSLSSLAKKFNVSRRMIQFITDPESKKENLRRRQERGGWRQYYDKMTNTESMREHRRYKKRILEERGLL